MNHFIGMNERWLDLKLQNLSAGNGLIRKCGAKNRLPSRMFWFRDSVNEHLRIEPDKGQVLFSLTDL